MAYSLGLTLYTLGVSRDVKPVDRPARPEGSLICLHAPSADAAQGMAELARRVVDTTRHRVLLCTAHRVDPMPGFLLQPPPPDTPAEVRAFLDHWHPDAVLLCDGEIRPALLHQYYERGTPLAMVNARMPVLAKGRAGWWPGLLRGLLARMPKVLTVDEMATRLFLRAGSREAAVEVSGRLEVGSAALRCTEAERGAMARLFGTRPVWLAAGLPEAEDAAVIEAHRAALRLAHRLLLIVVLEDASRANTLASKMEVEGWSVARRSSEEDPDAETEVYIVDTPEEYGLWYRLAPVTFLGGSLFGAGCERNPMEAAALGSSILYGPNPGTFAGIFGRLGAARAARAVTGGADLAEALSDLLAPDRAARLAHAAWGVASEGAEVTDRILALLEQMLKNPAQPAAIAAAQ